MSALFSDIVKRSHSPAAAIPIVKQLWLEFFLLKLAHFFISDVAQVFIDKGTTPEELIQYLSHEVRRKTEYH